MQSTINRSDIQARAEQLLNDRTRQWFIYHITKLHEATPIKGILQTNGEFRIELDEPIASMIEKLYEQLSDYEHANYPELFSSPQHPDNQHHDNKYYRYRQ
jgi:hypothetical protein